MCLSDGFEITLTPLHTITDEVFGVYLKDDSRSG